MARTLSPCFLGRCSLGAKELSRWRCQLTPRFRRCDAAARYHKEWTVEGLRRHRGAVASPYPGSPTATRRKGLGRWSLAVGIYQATAVRTSDWRGLVAGNADFGAVLVNSTSWMYGCLLFGPSSLPALPPSRPFFLSGLSSRLFLLMAVPPHGRFSPWPFLPMAVPPSILYAWSSVVSTP